MIRSLYTSVSSLITLENKQNVITNNMSNANTNGFKNDNLAMKAFDEVYVANRDKIVGGRNVKNVIGTLSLGAKIDDVKTHYTQGLLKETTKPTDFAIEGRGFFVVRKNTENGLENLYTRDGNFKIAMDGTLVTTDGDQVLGINNDTGAIEPIFVGNSKFVMDRDNVIQVDGFSDYKLLTADFESYDNLEKLGNCFYRGENPIMNSQSFIHQGAIEGSNVNLTDEMVNMMSVMRNFESSQKVVQMLDETLAKAANEIGAVR